MSINITVHGKPVTVQRERGILRDLESVKTHENDHRKKQRIVQVVVLLVKVNKEGDGSCFRLTGPRAVQGDRQPDTETSGRRTGKAGETDRQDQARRTAEMEETQAGGDAAELPEELGENDGRE